MIGEETKRALQMMIALCIVTLLIGGIYFLAEYRATSTPAAMTSVTVAPSFGQEPREIRGLEGVMTASGFYVTAVDGRARASGLAVGDTIRTAGGQPVRDPMQLSALGPGMQVGIQRGGQDLQWTLPKPGATNMRQAEARAVDVRGIEGQLTNDGLWINAVDGQARTWGIRQGDLIRSINGQPLSVQREATLLLRSLDPTVGFTFEIVRDGARLYLPYNTQAPPSQPVVVDGVGGATTPPPQLAQRTAGGFGWGAGWAANLGGTYCPSCGAFLPAGLERTTCWRCGAPLPANRVGTLSAPPQAIGIR